MRAALILFVLLFAHSTDVIAGRSVGGFRSGNWGGSAYINDNGTFSFCSISGGYQSGIDLMFALYPNGNWQVNFGRRGGFPPNTQNRIDLYVDERFVYGAPAVAVQELLVLNMPASAPLFQAMRSGYVLKAVTPGGTAQFDLDGTAVALVKLYECVQKHSQPQVAITPAPFGAPVPRKAAQAPVDAAEDYKVSREIVITYAANVLAAANISGYQFLPYEETKGFGDVVWKLSDGSIGALIVLKNITADVDLDAFAAEATRSDAQSCKGDFVSGKRAPRYVGPMEIRKAFSSCKADINAFHAEYSWLRLQKGMLVRYGSARFGEAALSGDLSSDTTTRSEEALLQVSFPQ